MRQHVTAHRALDVPLLLLLQRIDCGAAAAHPCSPGVPHPDAVDARVGHPVCSCGGCGVCTASKCGATRVADHGLALQGKAAPSSRSGCNAEACRPVCEQSLPAKLIRNGRTHSHQTSCSYVACLRMSVQEKAPTVSYSFGCFGAPENASTCSVLPPRTGAALGSPVTWSANSAVSGPRGGTAVESVSASLIQEALPSPVPAILLACFLGGPLQTVAKLSTGEVVLQRGRRNAIDR